MTRLQAFADRLVCAIQDAGDCHCGESYESMLAVAERMVRAFVIECDDGCGPYHDYNDGEHVMDEPEKP